MHLSKANDPRLLDKVWLIVSAIHLQTINGDGVYIKDRDLGKQWQEEEEKKESMPSAFFIPRDSFDDCTLAPSFTRQEEGRLVDQWSQYITSKAVIDYVLAK